MALASVRVDHHFDGLYEEGWVEASAALGFAESRPLVAVPCLGLLTLAITGSIRSRSFGGCG